jgi:hypothetical protein
VPLATGWLDRRKCGKREVGNLQVLVRFLRKFLGSVKAKNCATSRRGPHFHKFFYARKLKKLKGANHAGTRFQRGISRSPG